MLNEEDGEIIDQIWESTSIFFSCWKTHQRVASCEANVWRCSIWTIPLLSPPRWPHLETKLLLFKWWTKAEQWNSMNSGRTWIISVTDKKQDYTWGSCWPPKNIYQNTDYLKPLYQARDFVTNKECILQKITHVQEYFHSTSHDNLDIWIIEINCRSKAKSVLWHTLPI